MEQILVGVDSSPEAAGAEGWAARLAGRLGARLTVASVWWPSSTDLPDAEARTERDRARRLLDEVWSQPARATDTAYRAVLIDGDSPDALLDAADAADADLVVVGARGHRRFAGLHLGSFSDYVAHRITRPLAVIPSDRGTPIRRIVVGLDSAEGNLWVVDLCAALAASLGAEVTAVHAVRSPHAWQSPPPDWAERERAVLEDWAGVLRGAAVPLHTHLVEGGHPADGLLTIAADVDADLLMVGSRGVGGYRVLRLGGVTMQLLHHSDRPVMIVPPPE